MDTQGASFPFAKRSLLAIEDTLSINIEIGSARPGSVLDMLTPVLVHHFENIS